MRSVGEVGCPSMTLRARRIKVGSYVKLQDADLVRRLAFDERLGSQEAGDELGG